MVSIKSGISGARLLSPLMAPVVVLHKVNKWFGPLHVLQDVDLEVDEREVVVVVGPSGSGKSTLLRCINRLEPIDGGAIEVDGRPLPDDGRGLNRLRAKVGMVFQSFNLFPHMTALRNITVGPVHALDVDKGDAKERARQLLAKVGIEEKADAYPAEMSGGQQQRVAIARALAMRPKLMLFDEPTSALDPEMIKEVLDVMTELANEGMTMIVVSHEMGFARRVANRIVFMDEGRILEDAPPDQFFQAPATDRARDFLGKILDH